MVVTCRGFLTTPYHVYPADDLYPIFFRSVACWFDEEGTLVFDKFFADVNSLHNDIKSKKDN